MMNEKVNIIKKGIIYIKYEFALKKNETQLFFGLEKYKP